MRPRNPVIALALFAPGAAFCATIQVPEDFATIGMAASEADAGDVIEVDAATYVRELDEAALYKNLTVRGVNGRPVLPQIQSSVGAILIENATVRADDDPMAGDLGNDYGIIHMGGTLTLNDVVLEGMEHAPGLLVLSGVAILDDVVGSDFGGGELARPITIVGGELEISNSTFSHNRSGAISAAGARVDISDSTFYNNSADVGADIAAVGGLLAELTITSSTFQYSSAVSVGGSIAATQMNIEISDSTFSDCYADWSGGAIYVDPLTLFDPALVLTEVVFERNSSWLWGGAVFVGHANSTLDTCTFAQNFSTAFAGDVYFGSGTALVTNSHFSDFSTIGSGGSIYAEAALLYGAVSMDLTVEDSDFTGSQNYEEALSGGGIGLASGAAVKVVNTTFTDVGAFGSGGVFFSNNASLDLEGVTVADASAPFGGVFDMSVSELVIRGGTFDRNTASEAAVGYLFKTPIVVEGSSFSDNDADFEFSTFWLDQARGSSFVGNSFCHNRDTSAATIGIFGRDPGDHHLTNNLFVANQGGSNIAYSEGEVGQERPSVFIQNNDFVDNHVDTVFFVAGGQVDLRNNIVGGSPQGLKLASADAVTGGYNLWYDLDVKSDDNLFPGPGSVVDKDPLFQGYAPEDCGSNFWLMPDSPALDAGDPGMKDQDGSVIDIGAYGGEGAGLEDPDGDGSFEDRDCNEADAEIHPGALDIPYDGIDQDCSGADLCDVDGDDYDHIVCGGKDCDDGNKDVHPGAHESYDSKLDENCDGFESATWMVGGGGCSTSPAVPNAAWFGLLLAFGARRRD